MKPIKYLILFVTLLLVAACSDSSMPTADNSQDPTYLGSIELTLGETGLQVQSNTLLTCARFSLGNSTINTNTGFSFSVPYSIDTSNCSETLPNLGLIPLNLPNTVGNSPFISGATAIPQAVAESVEYVGATDVSANESELNAQLSGDDTPSLPGTIDIASATVIPSAFTNGTVAFTTSASFSGSMVVGVFSIADSGDDLPGVGGDDDLPGVGGDQSASVVFASNVTETSGTSCTSETVCTRELDAFSLLIDLGLNPNVPIELASGTSATLSLSVQGPSDPFTLSTDSLTTDNPNGNLSVNRSAAEATGTYVATINISGGGNLTYTLIVTD